MKPAAGLGGQPEAPIPPARRTPQPAARRVVLDLAAGGAVLRRRPPTRPRVESGRVTIRKRRKTTWQWTCRCERCGYGWTTLGDVAPTRCPGCHARNFERPARPYTKRKPK